MDTKEAAKLIGKHGRYRHRELSDVRFPVIVMDVRDVYGHTNVLVRPVGGTGTHWVRLSNVELE
jgi:hypothetical protein